MVYPTHLLQSNRPQCSVLQTNMQLKVLIALVFATLGAAAPVEVIARSEDAANFYPPFFGHEPGPHLADRDVAAPAEVIARSEDVANFYPPFFGHEPGPHLADRDVAAPAEVIARSEDVANFYPPFFGHEPKWPFTDVDA